MHDSEGIVGILDGNGGRRSINQIPPVVVAAIAVITICYHCHYHYHDGRLATIQDLGATSIPYYLL